MNRARRIFDITANSMTLIATLLMVFILFLIIQFLISRGLKLLNMDLILGDYNKTIIIIDVDEPKDLEADIRLEDDWLYSKRWGIALKDDRSKDNKDVIRLVYIHPDSPLNSSTNLSSEDGVAPKITLGLIATEVILSNNRFANSKDSASEFIAKIDDSFILHSLSLQSEGGGIRGSIITTLYLIFFALLFSVPFGVFAAVYLNEYALKNAFTAFIRNTIEMLTGIPSILFGFLGATLFIPLVNSITKVGTLNGSIYAGALTLTVILIPVIIRTVEEALKTVPVSLRYASLSLGASESQTIFKVIIPSAIPGILSAVVLSIGRIIGESAALIFAIGTVIKDDIAFDQRSTSLAVHIWSIMSSEIPNFELASAISLIILIIVMALNIIAKLITRGLQNR